VLIWFDRGRIQEVVVGDGAVAERLRTEVEVLATADDPGVALTLLRQIRGRYPEDREGSVVSIPAVAGNLVYLYLAEGITQNNLPRAVREDPGITVQALDPARIPGGGGTIILADAGTDLPPLGEDHATVVWIAESYDLQGITPEALRAIAAHHPKFPRSEVWWAPISAEPQQIKGRDVFYLYQ